MTVFRCTLQKWASDLSGTGAFLHGGRWNSPGLYMLYTAENNVLAAFEIALRIPIEHISKNYVIIPVEVPDNIAPYIPTLPKKWHQDQKITRATGDSFIRENKFLMMKVPSALISDSYNYLINPRHPLIKKVRALPAKTILFDQRLAGIMRRDKKL